MYAREKDDVLHDLRTYRASRGASNTMRIGGASAPAPGVDAPKRAIRQTLDQ